MTLDNCPDSRTAQVAEVNNVLDSSMKVLTETFDNLEGNIYKLREKLSSVTIEKSEGDSVKDSEIPGPDIVVRSPLTGAFNTILNRLEASIYVIRDLEKRIDL